MSIFAVGACCRVARSDTVRRGATPLGEIEPSQPPPRALVVHEQLLPPPVAVPQPARSSVCVCPPTQGAPASTGCALCSVLANLAMHEEFRGSFARPIPPGAAAAGGVDGGRASTVAAVLVLVAGDMTVRLHASRVYAFVRRGRQRHTLACFRSLSQSRGLRKQGEGTPGAVESVLPHSLTVLGGCCTRATGIQTDPIRYYCVSTGDARFPYLLHHLLSRMCHEIL